MALEKRLKAIPAQSFTANGTVDGLITVADAAEYKVKQEVFLSGSTLPDLDQIEIKRVIGKTQMYVGPRKGNIDARTDISAYTVALSAKITANEQLRPSIPVEQIQRAVYEEEPTVALRVFPVDELGNDYNADNPFPVAATFDGDVTVGDIRITACDDDPKVGDRHSSVRIAGTDCNNEMVVNSDGSINVVPSSGSSAAPVIANETITVANTEYSYSFPIGTKQFSIKDRDGNAKTRIAYTAGDTVTVYKTIDMGCVYEVGSISTSSGFNVYFQSNKPNRTLEIVSWT